jgi:type I restriction enzyme, S subunit
MQSTDQLPTNWRKTALSDVCRLLGGFAFKSEDYEPSGIPIIRISNVKEGGLDWRNRVFWSETVSPEIQRYLVQEGEVLISMTGDVGATCQVKRSDLPALLNQRVGRFSIRTQSELTNEFLLFATKTDEFRRSVSGNAFGAIQQNVSAKGIEAVRLNLPPLAEQQKIAGVLGLVQRAMEQQELLLALTAELKKTLLHHLFTRGLRGERQKQTEIGPVPKGWDVVRLVDLIGIKHGFAFAGQFFRPEGDHVLMTPGHFHEVGGFRDQGEKTKFFAGEFPPEYLLRGGDLLVAMTEQKTGLLGSAAFVPNSGKYLHNQRLGLIVDLKEEKLDKTFLYFTLNTTRVRSEIAKTSSGSKVRHTSPGKIRDVKIALPSLTEQRQIAETLSAVDAKHALHRRKHATLSDLFRTLLHQLMTAQLRVHDLDIEKLLTHARRHPA